jgi:glycine/D-amino acid oxidase-like deaminating enzyme
MTPSNAYDAIVVGGGFYGARLALTLRAMGRTVLLVEREATLLSRASLRNQARVHHGYHYPRSLLTSLRSRSNYARFIAEYSECVDQTFPHYYAIARRVSKVTASQFVAFCGRIGAPVAPAPASVAALFDSARVESVFAVQECAFDAGKLAARLGADLDRAGVTVLLETEVLQVGQRVRIRHGGAPLDVRADLVLNCTYSAINHLLGRSGAAVVPAKHELTEMALVEPPAELDGAAVTVMDGPFFSLMPYPSRGLFTLSHVRYTPHCTWQDSGEVTPRDGDDMLGGRESRFAHMAHDAARYLPSMTAARYVESLWEVKTIMPRSEQDDSRPILVQRSLEQPSCITVLGAKIDSIYDAEEGLRHCLLAEGAGAGAGAGY